MLPIEVKKLRYAFMQIDYDESGEVDADEFLEFVDERRSPFTDHIFKEFDADGSGEGKFFTRNTFLTPTSWIFMSLIQ